MSTKSDKMSGLSSHHAAPTSCPDAAAAESTDPFAPLQAEESMAMIQALTINYLNVFIIEPEENKGSILKLNGYVTNGILEAPKRFNYTEMLLTYMKDRVYPEDYARFRGALWQDALLKTFSGDRQQLELSYRAVDKEEIHYYSAHYIRISAPGQPLRLVAGFRNVDDLVLEQTRQHEKGMYKAYQTLSRVYLTMHRIDLLGDTFQEIKSFDAIRNAQIPKSGRYEANVRPVMEIACTPPFLEDMLRFMDIHTLPARMQGRSSIFYEFQGNFSGWCKANFIREDEDENGNLWHVILAIEAIDENKQRENRLRHLAETDGLTDILNRSSGELRIKRFLKSGTTGLFLIMDCDHFKSINDTYGHAAGDAVIKAIARSLKKTCRDDDVVMRLGGDEFAVYALGITTQEQAEGLWSRMCAAFDGIHLSQLQDYRIAISAGGAFCKDDHPTDFNSLYKKADDAMYHSKQYSGSHIKLL